jgi:hypothetical protein
LYLLGLCYHARNENEEAFDEGDGDRWRRSGLVSGRTDSRTCSSRTEFRVYGWIDCRDSRHGREIERIRSGGWFSGPRGMARDPISLSRCRTALLRDFLGCGGCWFCGKIFGR